MSKIKYMSMPIKNIVDVASHDHHYWEVIYYLKGSGIITIGSVEESFQAGDILLIPPYTPHTEHANSHYGFSNYNYQFEDSNFIKDSYMKFSDTEHQDFLIILKQMYYEYFLNREETSQITDSLYEVLFYYIMVFSKKGFKKNIYVEQVLREIVENISIPDYDINTTLDKIPLVKDYFRSLFVRETGKTPHQFLLKKRVEHAKKLLSLQKETGMTIKEIAYRSGFADAYYFSKIFKTHTGVSPKKYLSDL